MENKKFDEEFIDLIMAVNACAGVLLEVGENENVKQDRELKDIVACARGFADDALKILKRIISRGMRD